MIRRPPNRAKWSRARRLTLLLSVVWFVLLFIGDYIHMCGAPKDVLTEQMPKPHDTTPEVREEVKKGMPEENRKIEVPKEEVTRPVEWRLFDEALRQFGLNLDMVDGLGGDPEQPTADFTDIVEQPGRGVPLPYDKEAEADPRQWKACDSRNADFTTSRDTLCQAYLSNLSNVRYVKTMSSRLTHGRTIKFRLFYAHNEIEAIVKVSQKKFFFEATSEFLAFSVDRALNFSRVPTTAFTTFPLDYMRVATAYSPLFSQWLDRYIFQYNYTNKNFVPCDYPSRLSEEATQCAYVSIQLWMYDVHTALSTFLGLPYEYDAAFGSKYYSIGHKLWPPKPTRLRAVGELLDRFIFDFLIGNSDRGMNDHNNFVYGGCSYRTTCQQPAEERRIKGVAKYAFIDHGSSFYSHREVKGNPFTGELDRVSICRFRRSMYDVMRPFKEVKSGDAPLPMLIRRKLSPFIFRVTHLSVFNKVQDRMEKVLQVMEKCLQQNSEEEVFSIPEYWEVHIAEEFEKPPLVEDATVD